MRIQICLPLVQTRSCWKNHESLLHSQTQVKETVVFPVSVFVSAAKVVAGGIVWHLGMGGLDSPRLHMPSDILVSPAVCNVALGVNLTGGAVVSPSP